jgi:hypothetical protein
VQLVLLAPTGGGVLGSQSTVTLTIKPEPPGQVEFSTYTEVLPNGTVQATLYRYGGAAGSLTVPVTVFSSRFAVSPAAVTFADGQDRATVILSDLTGNRSGIVPVDVAVVDPITGSFGDTTTLRIDFGIPTVSLGTPVLVGARQYAAGSDAGTAGTATLYNPDKSVRFSVTPFGSFSGGVRTAAADFTGDGVADLVAGTGPGSATHVVVYDGVTQAVLFTIDPFEAAFTGGVYVAAGDLNGDGLADLVITPDEGGGPRVRVFSAAGFAQVADFFGINDPNFRGGARPALADITGDGYADLVVAAGFGGGPRVAVFSGAKVAAEGGLSDQSTARWESWKPFGDFLAFEPALRNGAFVGAGDVNGDGFADVVAGGGPGGGPRVTAFSGSELAAGRKTEVANFFAGDVSNRGGVRVAVKNLDGDDRADLVAGAGAGAGSRVTAYAGSTLTAGGPPPEMLAFDAFDALGGGVFVG